MTVVTERPTQPRYAGRALWRRWFLATTAGELAGFCVPALAGAFTYAAGLPAAPTVAVMGAAGFVEGLALGAAQGWALRPAVPHLPVRAFALATAAAAVVAYAIGMLPGSLGDGLTTAPAAVLIPAATIGGLLLLASIGTAQWLVLRRAGAGRLWWIATTAGAWLAGLTIFMLVATPLWRPGQPVALTAAIGVLAGGLMAATVAALTGFAAVRLASVTRHDPNELNGVEQ